MASPVAFLGALAAGAAGAGGAGAAGGAAGAGEAAEGAAAASGGGGGIFSKALDILKKGGTEEKDKSKQTRLTANASGDLATRGLTALARGNKWGNIKGLGSQPAAAQAAPAQEAPKPSAEEAEEAAKDAEKRQPAAETMAPQASPEAESAIGDRINQLTEDNKAGAAQQNEIIRLANEAQ